MGKAKPGVPVKVADGVYAWMQNDQGGWGFNNLGLVTSRGQSLVIDTTSDVPLTRQAIKDWRNIDPGVEQIDSLFVTHQHWDHVAGMCAAEFEGARIIASDSVSDYLADFPHEAWLTRVAHLKGIAKKQMDENLGHGDHFDFRGIYTVNPTETFTGSYEFMVGDERIEIFENPQSHSPSDSFVHIPGKSVVHLGDVTVRRKLQDVQHPGMVNCIAGLKQLIKWDAKVYIPGHGALMTLQDVKDQLDNAEWVLAEVRKLYDKGLTYDEAVDAFIRNLKNGPYKDWRGARSMYWTIRMMYSEFNGVWTDHMRRNNNKYLETSWKNAQVFKEKYPGVI